MKTTEKSVPINFYVRDESWIPESMNYQVEVIVENLVIDVDEGTSSYTFSYFANDRHDILLEENRDKIAELIDSALTEALREGLKLNDE